MLLRPTAARRRCGCRRRDGRAPDGEGGRALISRAESFTNRVLRVDASTQPFVLRIPKTSRRPDIDRVAELDVIALAAGAGVGPSLLFADASDGVIATAVIDGVHPTPAALQRDRGLLGEVVAGLRRIHALVAERTPALEPRARVDLYVDALTQTRHGRARFDAIADHFRAACAVVDAVPMPQVLSHGDPWPENILIGPDGLRFVDWEFASIASPLWDLAGLSVEADLDAGTDAALLELYFDGRVTPDVVAAFQAWRAITHVVWGLWALFEDSLGNDKAGLVDYGLGRLDRAAALLRIAMTAR